MHRLIIIRGNSGSGKTTVARALQQRLGHNTMCISQDAVRRDMLRVKDGADTPALPLLMELLQYGRRNSEIVILEGILHSEWYRPLFERAVQLYGAEIYAYYFDLPFKETLRRHWTKPNCHEFGEEAMKSWWREKDYSAVLSEAAITADRDQESIVREILDAVLSGRKAVRAARTNAPFA